jgi:hypothetical protein
MTTISLGNASPTEDIKQIDLKHVAIQIQPVILDTPSLTPAATPEETSPAEEDAMTGKKIFSMERPDDRARELATKLTLEEQVRFFSFGERSGPPERQFHDPLIYINPHPIMSVSVYRVVLTRGYLHQQLRFAFSLARNQRNSVFWRLVSAARIRFLPDLFDLSKKAQAALRPRKLTFPDLIACRSRLLADCGYP